MGPDDKGIALVANLDSDTVTPVDLGTWRAGPPIPVGHEPVAIAVFAVPSGAATAFVADFGSNAVTPIDVATLQAGAAIPAGPEPQTIAVAGGEVLVGNFGNHTLTPIDALTQKAGGATLLPFNPTGIAVTPSGATAYVCGGAGVVAIQHRRAWSPRRRWRSPMPPRGSRSSADDATAWITQQAGSLVPVTLATGTVGAPIHLGGHPSAVVIGAG